MGSEHKYFVIAKHDFYLEDAKKAFAGVGISIRVSNRLELLQKEILDSAGNCTVFVPHYSKIINLDDFPNVKFIGFHTGDLPKDRGGSPIQNKILKTHTVLPAFLHITILLLSWRPNLKIIDVQQSNDDHRWCWNLDLHWWLNFELVWLWNDDFIWWEDIDLFWWWND